jgi:hypothetical protein
MNTLRMLTAGMLLAASATVAMAAEEPSVPTVMVTAKRHVTVPAEPPREAVQIPVILPTDMPEAEIDYHLTPVTPPPAPAVERATL